MTKTMKRRGVRRAAPAVMAVVSLALTGCVVPALAPGGGASTTSEPSSSTSLSGPSPSPTPTASAGPAESTGAPAPAPTESTASAPESSAAPAESPSAVVVEPTEPAAAPSDESTKQAEPLAGSAQGGDAENVAVFGETLTRHDGLALTVSRPTPFAPSEWAAGGEGSAAHVRFEVTVENGTGEPFDPSMIFTSASSGGVEADEVFDEGIGDSPMTTLLPGRSVTFALGYGVADPSDVLVQVEVDWDTEPALFGTEPAIS